MKFHFFTNHYNISTPFPDVYAVKDTYELKAAVVVSFPATTHTQLGGVEGNRAQHKFVRGRVLTGCLKFKVTSKAKNAE